MALTSPPALRAYPWLSLFYRDFISVRTGCWLQVFGGIRLSQSPSITTCWKKGTAIYRDRNHDGKIDWEVSGETWRYDGIDIYKVDTNYDGFYDVQYSVGGITGGEYSRKAIHERVPVVGRNFIPIEKPSWVQ